jgi:two-component system chemotaxis response regulator CheY
MNFKGTVLLVDDEPHIRKFVALMLKQVGVSTIIEAANGHEAIAQYQQENPDLVLLDINMPVMDGLETLQQLRQINPEAVVVMLTSMVNRQNVDQALALGATNYIRKDTQKEAIMQVLTETIDACFETE